MRVGNHQTACERSAKPWGAASFARNSRASVGFLGSKNQDDVDASNSGRIFMQ